MRGIALFAIALWFAAFFPTPVRAMEGGPDPSFGDEGYAQIDTASAGSDINRVIAGVAGPSGKTYAISRLGNPNLGTLKGLVTRVTRSGQLDTTFNGSGFATTAFASPYVFWAMDAVATTDGGVLVAGIVDTPMQARAVVCKFTTTGALDASFGLPNDAGCPVLAGNVQHPSALSVRGRLIAITPHFSGYIIASTALDNNDTKVRVSRLNANGTADNLFGTSGTFELPSNGLSGFQTHAVAATAAGKIFVAGTVRNETTTRAYIAGFGMNGIIDASWDMDGIQDFPATTFGGTNMIMFTALRVLANGQLAAGGSIKFGMFGEIYGLMVRLNDEGGVFPSQEQFPLAFPGGSNFSFYVCDVCTYNEIVDIDQTADGTVYLTGNYGAGNIDAYVIRLDSDFAPDMTFGYEAVQAYSFDALPTASGQDAAAGVVVNNGEPTFVGQHGDGSPSYPVFVRLGSELIFRDSFD